MTISWKIILLCIITGVSCTMEPPGREEELLRKHQESVAAFDLYTKAPKTIRDPGSFPEVYRIEDKGELIRILNTIDCYYNDAVGLAGSYVIECAIRERLVQLATKNDLEKLLHNGNPQIRYIALKGLKEKFADQLDTLVFEHLKKDTAGVCEMSGCIQMTLPMKDRVD